MELLSICSLVKETFRSTDFIADPMADSWKKMDCLCYITEHESLYNSRCEYSAITYSAYINCCLYGDLFAAHSAVSGAVTIKDHAKLSEYPFISHYLKDIYNKHPTLPKIYGICGICFVLDYYNSIETIDKLQNKGPMQNTVMLFMISGRKLIYNNCRYYNSNWIE